jgi:hypothetical protein
LQLLFNLFNLLIAVIGSLGWTQGSGQLPGQGLEQHCSRCCNQGIASFCAGIGFLVLFILIFYAFVGYCGCCLVKVKSSNFCEGCLSNCEDLSVNSITTLGANAFVHLPKLVGLAISNNLLTSTGIDGAFNGLHKLESLLLDFNPNLASLPNGMLTDTVKLVELSVSNCAIAGQLPSDLFATTTKMKFATLFGNSKLSVLPSGLFDNTPELFLLSVVVTSMNDTSTSWPANLLSNTPQLQELHVSLNGGECLYEDIPTALVNDMKKMPNLHGFVLWGCPTLTKLPDGLFDSNPKLGVVYFFQSGITSFSEDLFAKQHRLKIVALDWSNVTTDCAFAARQDALYDFSSSGAASDPVSFVCGYPCGGLCPMIRTLKTNSPGVYVTFGNFIPQSGDPGSKMKQYPAPVMVGLAAVDRTLL